MFFLLLTAPPPVVGRCPRNLRSNIGCPIMKNPECDRDRDCSRTERCCTIGCSKWCINSNYKPPIRLHLKKKHNFEIFFCFFFVKVKVRINVKNLNYREWL